MQVSMELGLVGLGRMGADMAARLTAHGHRVVGFDIDPDVRAEASGLTGAEVTTSLGDLVEAIGAPRATWIQVPHGEATDATIDRLLELLDPGDAIVDGGNSLYTRSMAAAHRAEASGIDLLDIGVSGGVWGRRDGYCLMIGGPESAYRRLEPIFAALAPSGGYARLGASGAGHFVKMVHNAIEYAQLEALGEGFSCLNASPFELDLGRVSDLWQRGSVVRSWLLELLGEALEEEGDGLEGIEGWVEDSGMGRWSVEFAVDNAIPVPAIAASLFQRFSSRDRDAFSAKVVAALRNQFGGHAVREVVHD